MKSIRVVGICVGINPFGIDLFGSNSFGSNSFGSNSFGIILGIHMKKELINFSSP